MLHSFFDLLFPSMSLRREAGVWLTEDERAALRTHAIIMEGPLLLKAGLPSLGRLVAAAPYASSPLLREAIRRWKYRRVSTYTDVLGRMIVEASAFHAAWPEPVLCPVPLHWTRHFARGFNQAQVLADAVAHARGWPVRSLLLRTRPTGFQAHRSGMERREALRDAFAMRTGEHVPARVILIDDVVTTGATIDACALTLKKAGVARVDAIALAVALT